MSACSNQDQLHGIVSNDVTLTISGEITKNTLEEFRTALDEIKIQNKSIKLNAVRLDSIGGNNSVAIEIGKIIREKKLNTYVAEDSRCESACVLILIAGVQRYPFGKVGVHRTTYTRDIDDDTVVPNDIKRSEKLISNYIKSMGVSLLLDDAINNTESWRMRYLTDTEKKQWQIFGIDRLEEELYFNRTARERGIPRSEFIKIFKSNYDDCLKEVKNFKNNILDCSKSKLYKSQGFFSHLLN